MLRFLFPGLTKDDHPRGRAMFDAAVAEARRPFWYSALGIPDTLDGRFAVLATVTALAIVRLERGNSAAQAASVALSERFIESMDVEHRQLGYGDPTIGKIVRKLTGSLARRVEQFRAATDGTGYWEQAVHASFDVAAGGDTSLTGDATSEVRSLWHRLEQSSDAQMIEGNWS